jgi:hypothetical protein
VEAHAEPVRSLDLEPVEARGGDSRGRVPRGEKARRQVGAAVAREIRRDGQGAKVYRISRLDLEREGWAVEDDGLDRLLQPLGVFLRKLRLVDPESRREPSPARRDIRHDGDRVAADLLEDQQGKPPPPLELQCERLRLVGEVHGLRDAHHFARVGLLQRRYEAAEALTRPIVVPRSRHGGILHLAHEIDAGRAAAAVDGSVTG